MAALIQPQDVRPTFESQPSLEVFNPAPNYADTEILFENIQTLKEGSAVTQTHLLETDSIKEGYIERYGLVTESGFAYDAMVGMPKNRRSDIPVFGTGAWLTSTRGHNEHFLRHMMRAGSPIIFVGAEGSYRSKDQNRPIHIPSLAGSAAATLSISQTLTKDHHYLFDQTKRILIGESRGAMVGMGILALDKLFDQEVVYADLTAPCFPKGLEFKDVVNLARNINQEPVSFARSLANLTLKQIIHYPATVDMHPYALIHQGLIGSALFSGEAGDLARLIPEDKIIHITCFDHDISTMRDEWKAIFVDHPNVRLTPLKGSHLTVADPQTQAYIEARIQAFLASYEQGQDDIDGQDLFNSAHQLVKDPS